MKIQSIKPLAQSFERYDLEIEDNHNFIAEGVVVHNSSAHIGYDKEQDKMFFFHGGSNRGNFLANFNEVELTELFRENAKDHPALKKITIYGEAYGGSTQGQAHRYGPNLKFIAFEVLLDDEWLSVETAERLACKFQQEFVPWKIIDTTEEAINAEMMADSVVAIRRGMGPGLGREGVVLRPIIELQHPNGGRIICKHKRPEFSERKNTPSFTDPAQQKILEEANAIVEEWCLPERLRHVLDAFPNAEIQDVNKIILAMQEDILREAAGEIVDSKDLRRLIRKKTVTLFKEYLYKR